MTEERKWINVKDRLPHALQIVWIYWRDREVLLGCRTCEDSEPSEYWYSFEDEKCKWANWWMPHEDHPFDKPNAPNYMEEKSSESVVFKRCAPLTNWGKFVQIQEVNNSHLKEKAFEEGE